MNRPPRQQRAGLAFRVSLLLLLLIFLQPHTSLQGSSQSVDRRGRGMKQSRVEKCGVQQTKKKQASVLAG